VLDTGSECPCSQKRLRERLASEPWREEATRWQSRRGRFEIVYGYVNSIDVGDVHIDNVPVYIRHFYEEREPVDGYLGISALGRLITTVDYGARRLTLIRQRNSERLISQP